MPLGMEYRYIYLRTMGDYYYYYVWNIVEAASTNVWRKMYDYVTNYMDETFNYGTLILSYPTTKCFKCKKNFSNHILPVHPQTRSHSDSSTSSLVATTTVVCNTMIIWVLLRK